MKRPSWDSYFTDIAKLTSTRSNCIRRAVGCIIVKNTRILSLGYNGTARGMLNCYEGGCKRCCEQKEQNGSTSNEKEKNKSGINLDLCMCLHAEENALLFISQSDLVNSTMYVTHVPCIGCTKKIMQCKISRVVYLEEYSKELDDISKQLLTSCGVIIEKYRETEVANKVCAASFASSPVTPSSATLHD